MKDRDGKMAWCRSGKPYSGRPGTLLLVAALSTVLPVVLRAEGSDRFAGPMLAHVDTPDAALDHNGAPTDNLRVALGLGPFLYPSYPGGRIYRVLPFPYVEGSYGSAAEFELFDGLRLSLLRTNGFAAGPIARYRWGRTSHDSQTELLGLRRVNDTVEIGGFVSYTVGSLWLDLTGTQDVLHGHGGAVLEARATLSLPITAGLGIEIGPFLRAATGRFTQAYYGISALEARRSGRPIFAASGGLERGGLAVAAQLHLTSNLSLRSQVEFGRLFGSAATSPLSQHDGSTDQIYAGLFLVWQWR